MDNKLCIGLDTFIRQYGVVHYSAIDDENTVLGIYDDKKLAFDHYYALSDEIINDVKVYFIIYKGTFCTPLKSPNEMCE